MYSYSNMHEEHTWDYSCVCGIMSLCVCAVFSLHREARSQDINYTEANWRNWSLNQGTSAGADAGRSLIEKGDLPI